MRLYLLKKKPKDPLFSGFDVVEGCVVRAASPRHARRIAKKHHAGEGVDAWDPEHSTCAALSETGRAGLVLKDFKAG